MKTKLADLNDYLFAQIERLSDEGLSDEQIAREAHRAAAIAQTADRILHGGELQLKAARLMGELPHGAKLPKMLTDTPPANERKK